MQAVAGLLKARDRHIIAAMDGADASASKASPRSSDPALFFYVIFGLAFQQVAEAAAGSGRDVKLLSGNAAGTALEVIAGLVQHAVAGDALMRDGLIEELCGLCLRLVGTGNALVKARIVDAVVAVVREYVKDLATPSLTNGCDRILLLRHRQGITKVALCCYRIKEHDNGSIAGQTPLRSCLEVLVDVLQSSVPSSETSVPRGEME